MLNSPPGAGPCYRCVFPKPPPPESVVGCGEGGILGPVVGVMGVLQALEAIKLISGGELEVPLVTGTEAKPKQTMMLLFGGMTDSSPFRSVRMRGKRTDCFACSGSDGALTLEMLRSSMDYVQFCGITQPVDLLQPDERITAETYGNLSRQKQTHLLVDVREKEHFSICNIKDSINIPISRFTSHRGDELPADWIPADLPPNAPIYIVCRVGNDSQIAAKKLKDLGAHREGERFIGDIQGGLKAWRDAVDPTLPFI